MTIQIMFSSFHSPWINFYLKIPKPDRCSSDLNFEWKLAFRAFRNFDTSNYECLLFKYFLFYEIYPGTDCNITVYSWKLDCLCKASDFLFVLFFQSEINLNQYIFKKTHLNNLLNNVKFKYHFCMYFNIKI